jgi:ketosteroid isomerase-like protein
VVRENLVELVRHGWEAAARGDYQGLAEPLDPDVRWHAAGDDRGGCNNRSEALGFMQAAIKRGVRVELLDARRVGEDRVIVLLPRTSLGEDGELPPTHGEIITFLDGRVLDMAVFPTAEEALDAVGASEQR